MGEIADAGEEQPQHADQDAQGLVGPARDGRLEGPDGVRYGLHPGHGRASGGEGAHQQPERDRRRGRGQRGRSQHWVRMAPGAHRLEQAEPHEGQEAGDEAIGRQGEEQAALAEPAKVGEGDEGQHREAEGQGVGMQGWNRGGQGPDARRDPHRHVQGVVDHQGRSGQQAGVAPEVLLGDGIGAAVGLIGDRCLAIGKVEHRQEQDDGGHHGAQRLQSRRAHRRQHGQSGLRPVGGRSQAVEPHDGHRLEPADAARLVFPVREAAAEQKIDDTHY